MGGCSVCVCVFMHVCMERSVSGVWVLGRPLVDITPEQLCESMLDSEVESDCQWVGEREGESLGEKERQRERELRRERELARERVTGARARERELKDLAPCAGP